MPRGAVVMKIQAFFDSRTSTLSYVAFDEVERVGVPSTRSSGWAW
jgi:hypothetical protein